MHLQYDQALKGDTASLKYLDITAGMRLKSQSIR